MARYAGRPVVLGPGILAARTEFVAWVREVGGTALVLATAHGAGPKPADGDCVVVEVEPPPTSSVTEEMRALDHLARHLPRARRARRSRPSTPSGGPSGWAARS